MVKQKPTSSVPSIPDSSLPSDKAIQSLADVIAGQIKQENKIRKYASVKYILTLLAKGAALSAIIMAPKSATALKPLLIDTPDWDEWKHFNTSYLRRTLKQLQDQKDVEIVGEGETGMIQLTTQGKRKILKYSISSIRIEIPKRWDGKWRLVLYDVPRRDKNLGDAIRKTLRNLEFYPIQESVYIHPYPCFDQVQYLREYYALGNHVQYMVVDRIENDQAYKTYFNLS